MPAKVTTLEMEVALMHYYDVRRNIIVPNIYWGMPFLNHEVDICVVTPSGYATEVEIKVSRSDLRKDAKKKHNHDNIYLKHLYFAVPEAMEEYALEHIPENAGLLVGVKRETSALFIKLVKRAPARPHAKSWSDAHVKKVCWLGTMRLEGLKRKQLEQMKYIKYLKKQLKELQNG